MNRTKTVRNASVKKIRANSTQGPKKSPTARHPAKVVALEQSNRLNAEESLIAIFIRWF